LSELSETLRLSNPGAFSVLHSMVNYLFILDFKGKTLLTSQSVLEDTDQEQEFYEQKDLSSYLIDKKTEFNILESFLLMQPQSDIELELRRADESVIPVRLLSTTLLKEFFDNEDLILVLCSDLRLQKKAQATLLQSNKMASLGEMSSGLAHELNNPLTIMEGQLRRLKDYMYDEDITKEETVDLVDKVQRNLGRAVKIIKSFRSISRKGDQDPFLPVRLEDLLDEVRELTEKRLENNNIEFQILFKNKDLSIACKKSSLLQVFINLINNAVDAIEHCDKKWIKLHIIEKERKILCTIMDSGDGVSLENQVKLFEPFFTTKDIGKGTGLGLSISRSIVEEHSGSLTYTDSMKSSCFVIALPIAQDS
jgi:C4-dicarboxylate-specific signal transduction histidine kinase